jgi:hypothetical protein
MTPAVVSKRPCQPLGARGLRGADKGMSQIIGGHSEPALLIADVVEIHVGQMADFRQETSNEGHDEH